MKRRDEYISLFLLLQTILNITTNTQDDSDLTTESSFYYTFTFYYQLFGAVYIDYTSYYKKGGQIL